MKKPSDQDTDGLQQGHRACELEWGSPSLAPEADPGAFVPGPEPIPEDADPQDPKYQRWPYVDLRVTPDRRAKPTPWWASLLGMKRRQRGRRTGESQNAYVDVYDKRDVAMVAAIFLLNLIDAGLTIEHLSNGGGEANPVANQVLVHFGYWGFLWEKVLVVGLAITTLVVHKNFSTARIGMRLMLAGYAALSLYHLFLRLL